MGGPAPGFPLPISGLFPATVPGTDATTPTFGPQELLAEGTLVNGRYRVLSVLGSGGMGVVYRVVDMLHPDRDLALKCIRGAFLHPEQVGLFKAEFRTMARLVHQNVAAVHDFESMQGTDDHLFTMEYVEGSSLEASIGSPWPKVLDLLVPVCRALSFMHSRQVVHLDLKPANVLVRTDGVIKVLDFGLAGAKNLTARMIVGTPAYMAPELSIGDLSSVDHRADLYSLGVMAWELLTGNLPWNPATPAEILSGHRRPPLEPADGVDCPGWLRDIVERLCAPDRSERFRSANDVIEAINRGAGLDHELETRETSDSYILSGQFVGRDDEFTRVINVIVRRSSGLEEAIPPALFVCGPSGIGKSRLMREVRQHLQLSRMFFAEGNCYEGGFSEYGPMAEVVAPLVLAARSLGATGMLERFAPELTRLCPAVFPLGDGTGRDTDKDLEAERTRLMDRVTEFLVRVSELTPFALYINDLQWAQAGTIELLQHLILRIAHHERVGLRVRIAVLGSYRTDEIANRPVAGLIDRLVYHHACDFLHLDPLPDSKVERLIGSMIGEEGLSEAFVRRISSETAGNPFFVEEVMRSLVENGTVAFRDGHWVIRPDGGNLGIPDTVTSLFLRRAAMLDVDHRRVLDCLAVSGRPTGLDVLGSILGMDQEVLHRMLGDLVSRQMVRRRSGNEAGYVVGHDRIRESLYQSLPQEQRCRIHIDLAGALGALSPDGRDERIFQIAHHLRLGNAGASALQQFLTAGRKALNECANDLASEFLEHSLELLDEGEKDGSSRLEVLEQLGDLASLRGNYDRAIGRYDEVLEAADSPLIRARIRRKMGNVFLQKGDLEAAIDHLWKALEQLGERRPGTTVGEILAVARAGMGQVVRNFMTDRDVGPGNPSSRSHLLEIAATYLRLTYPHFYHRPLGMLLPALRAARFSEKAGRSRELSHAYSTVGLVHAIFGLHSMAAKLAFRALRTAEEVASPWHVAQTHSFRGAGLFYRSRWQEALELLQKARDGFLEYGDMYELGSASVHGILCLVYQGRLGEALDWAQSTLDILERTGSMQLGKALLVIIGGIQARLGHFDEAWKDLDRAESLCQATGDHMILCSVGMEKGHTALLLDDAEGAIRHLEQARRLKNVHRIPLDYIMPVDGHLARAWLSRADREQNPSVRRYCLRNARHQVREARRVARTHRNYQVPAILVSAILAWQTGHSGRARIGFARAISVAKEQGAMQLLADACCEAGRYLMRGNGEDVRRARVWLKQGVEASLLCGSSPFEQRNLSLLQGIPEVDSG